MNKFCVITGDLRKSRKLKNREEIQEGLKEILNKINQKYKERIIGRFILTGGDEFQGMLKTLQGSYSLLLSLEKIPVNFYCGIGVGGINTKISSKVSEMDGEAFYKAREALQEAKKLRQTFLIKSGNPLRDKTLNVLFSLLGIIKEGWTSRQREITAFTRQNELTYKEIGKKVGISKQAISQILKSAHWKEVRRAEEIITQMLDSVND